MSIQETAKKSPLHGESSSVLKVAMLVLVPVSIAVLFLSLNLAH